MIFPVSAFAHVRGDSAAHQEHARCVHIEDGVPLLKGDVVDRVSHECGRPAVAVHQNVDPPHPLDGGAYDVLRF